MNKPNIGAMMESAKSALVKHSPEILIGLGISGMLTTTVLAVKATPKALKIIEEKKKEKKVEKLPPVDVVKATWKCYIPAAVTATASTACLIGANSVHLRRNAALATAYKLSETALTEYREQVVQTVGEKKEQTIREAVAKEKIKKQPVKEEDVVRTKHGSTKCYEPLSGRYFYSSAEAIRRAEIALNKRLLHDICGSVTLNDFYDELEIPRTEVGDSLGWNTDAMVALDLSSHLDENDIPCLYVGHLNAPRYDY